MFLDENYLKKMEPQKFTGLHLSMVPNICMRLLECTDLNRGNEVRKT